MSEPSKSSDREDAYALLIADHRAVEALFAAFKPVGEADEDARFTLVKRACEELTVHSMLEEELLYPAAREAAPELGLELDESLVEHYLAKALIFRYTTLKPSHAGFDGTFRVLAELVRRHVEEEESKLFPKLRKSRLDALRLGKKIAARKTELTAKLDAAGARRTGDRSLTLSREDFPI